MIHLRTALLVLGGAGLSATLAGCGSAEVPAAAPSPAAIVSEGPDTGDLLLHGRVLRDGEPVEGAGVEVEAWPAEDDTAAGEDVDLFEVGTTTSRSDGTWSVELDHAEVPERYLLLSDTVNLELLVTEGDLATTWSVPVTHLPDGVWRSSEHVGIDGPAMRLDLDLAGGRIVQDDGIDVLRQELTTFPWSPTG